jgi:hypothetical protein
MFGVETWHGLPVWFWFGAVALGCVFALGLYLVGGGRDNPKAADEFCSLAVLWVGAAAAVLALVFAAPVRAIDYTPGGSVSYTPGAGASSPESGEWGKVPPDRPALTIAKAAPAVQVVPAGWHSHVCANGHEWWHGPEMAGNAAAHHCPVCGLQDWTPNQTARQTLYVSSGSANYPSGGISLTQHPIASPAQSYAIPTGFGSSCPNGNCPAVQSGQSYRRSFFGR